MTTDTSILLDQEPSQLEAGKRTSDSTRGFLMVYTGPGKGKTSAALGMALRAVGYGKRVCFLQFVKGTWHASEIDGLKRLEPELSFHRAGAGFYQIVDDKATPETHKAAAQEGKQLAITALRGGEYFLVILDELNVAVSEGLLELADLEAILAARRPETHLLITGRGAPQALQDQADLVTVMQEVKHPYQKGLFARKGIDY